MCVAGDSTQLGQPDWGGFLDHRAARRAAARRYHPDVGGSAENMIAAFTAIDAHFISRLRPPNDGVVVVVRGGLAHTSRKRWRRWNRRRRARHYISL